MNRTWRKLGVVVAILALVLVATAAITLVNLTTQVTGVLPTANGGTGQNSSATFPASGTVMITTTGVTAAQMPALTGDITTSSGAVATSLAHVHQQSFATTTAPGCSVGGVTTFIGLSNSSTSEGNVGHWVPVESYTVSKLAVGLAANVPASESAVFTIMDQNAGTTVTCTIAAGASACSDGAHSFSVVANTHIVDIKVVCSGGTTSLTQPVFIGMGYK